MHGHETGFWQGYSENNVPEPHGQNSADHEYNSFVEEQIQSMTFENRNGYQPAPGQHQDIRLPDSPFPGFKNVPQAYNNGYSAYNSYLDHRRDYPTYRAQHPSNNHGGNIAYDEDLQNSFYIRNSPQSLWQNSGSKIKYPNYRAADSQNLGSVTKISNVLARFEKQPEIEKWTEEPPLPRSSAHTRNRITERFVYAT